MKTKRFLLLASFMIALMGYLPVAAQSECVINTAGNAYITSGNSASIDERKNSISNWTDKETVISFYFRVNECGKINIALQAKGKSRIEVSLLGKRKKVTLNSNTLSRVDLGTFKVKKAGYVKMDVRGVKINEGNDFGSIASVIVGGETQDISFVAPDFSTHFGRRGPSVHLGYVLPKEDIEWFYNEVVVPEEGDIASSYYMACPMGTYGEAVSFFTKLIEKGLPPGTN